MEGIRSGGDGGWRGRCDGDVMEWCDGGDGVIEGMEGWCDGGDGVMEGMEGWCDGGDGVMEGMEGCVMEGLCDGGDGVMEDGVMEGMV